jgi:hypothetical protein
VTTEVGLNIGDFRKNKSSLWLGDSGVSCHMTNDMDGMFDCRKIKAPIKIGNGQSMIATHVDSKRMMILSKLGHSTEIVLYDVKYVPNLWVNLFSLTQALQRQWL